MRLRSAALGACALLFAGGSVSSNSTTAAMAQDVATAGSERRESDALVEELLSRLLPALGSQHPHVRSYAARMVGETLAHPQAHRARIAERAIDGLIEALRDSDDDVIDEAHRALLRITRPAGRLELASTDGSPVRVATLPEGSLVVSGSRAGSRVRVSLHPLPPHYRSWKEWREATRERSKTVPPR